jgi:hypothetical protein
MSRRKEAQTRQEVARATAKRFVEIIDESHADYATIDATDSAVPLIVIAEEVPQEVVVRVEQVTFLKQTEPSKKEKTLGLVYDVYQISGNFKATNQTLYTWKIVPEGADAPFVVSDLAMFPAVHIPFGSVCLSANGEDYIRPLKEVGCYQSTSMKTAMKYSADEISAIILTEAMSRQSKALKGTKTTAKKTE